MFAILKREVKAYFQTVIGWLFIAAVLVLYGLYFYVYNLCAMHSIMLLSTVEKR